MEVTLHERVTQALMDNGAAVTKTSVDAVVKLIAERDQQTIQAIITDAERRLSILQNGTH